MAEIRGLLSVCDKQLHYGNQIISRGLSSVEPSLALDYSHQKGPHSRRVAGLSSLVCYEKFERIETSQFHCCFN